MVRRSAGARRGATVVAMVAMATAGLVAPEAAASGLSSARFGGEQGHPTTDNPTALYYNPAGIALSRGTRIFVDGTLALRWASYTRPESAVSSQTSLDIAPGANDGKATLSNQIFAPFAGVTSDFGTKFMTAGAAAYFPFGGSATWDQNEKYRGNSQFPGAVDGAQRWYTIDGSLKSMYLTGGIGFNFPQIGLSVGATGSVIHSTVNTIRARNADGTDDLVSGSTPDTYRLKEGRSLIDVAGWQGGFSVGALWNLREVLWIGASYTSQPNVTGGMTLTGTLTNVLALSDPETQNVELTQTLPDILRLGVRVRPTRRLELRVFGDYTRWSVFKRQCVLNSSIDGRRCDFAGDETALSAPATYGAEGEIDGVVQHLPRFWKDAGGVRIGASYWIIESLEAFIGAGYDSSAVPVQTLDPALMDMDKGSVSIGARWQIVQRFALALTSTQIIYRKVDTKGQNLLNKWEQPTRQASADGVYTQFLSLISIYADVHF